MERGSTRLLVFRSSCGQRSEEHGALRDSRSKVAHRGRRGWPQSFEHDHVVAIRVLLRLHRRDKIDVDVGRVDIASGGMALVPCTHEFFVLIRRNAVDY